MIPTCLHFWLQTTMLAAEDNDGLPDIAHARLGCTGTGVRSCWKKQVQQDLHGQAEFLHCLRKLLSMPGEMRQVPRTSWCINVAASNNQLCKGAHASLSAVPT